MSRVAFTDAVTAQAFTDEDGRSIVHCFIGTMGADWDVSSVLAEINGARDVAWQPHWLFADHGLAVLNAEGRVRHFAVTEPLR